MERPPNPSPDPHWPDQLRYWTHDLLNDAYGIRELVHLLDEVHGDSELHDLLALAATRLVEEVRALHAVIDGKGDPLGRLSEVALSDLLRDVRAACVGLAGTTGRFLRVGPAPEVVMLTDPGLLRRALVNLVRSALESAPSGTMAGLTTTVDGEMVTFTVHNPGGVPSYLDPGRPAASAKGNGLGLHAVGTLVQRHLGGELRVRSEPGAGITLAIVVPRRLRLAEPAEPYCALPAGVG